MTLLKTCEEFITLQKSIFYTRKNIETARGLLIKQMIHQTEPTYISDIHRSKSFIIEQSSKIKELLGFRELPILRQKAIEYRALREEYYQAGRIYQKKSMRNSAMGGNSVGAEYNFEKPIKLDVMGYNHPILISGDYCQQISRTYLACAEESKDTLEHVEKTIAKRTRIR